MRLQSMLLVLFSAQMTSLVCPNDEPSMGAIYVSVMDLVIVCNTTVSWNMCSGWIWELAHQ
ncbi:hypothetical protein M758_UG165100 [Ceratodon purpureus]|nr:hypothetical protein M758_UG165100 [Ceratodon purpureus]